MFAAPALGQAATILVLGDSIGAGYGLEHPDTQGWVGLLQNRLSSAGKSYAIVNASVSGEISAGGLSRVDALLARHKPQALILELGANDGLRGLPPAKMRENLNEIMARAEKAGAKVVLLGMRIPPNYGKRYNDLFEAVFAELARARGAAFTPFLLEGVGGEARYMQADGLHPNAEAQPLLMKAVWDKLAPLL